MEYYFAYGSNLNINRMKERGIKYKNIIPAKLEHFELKFNKISKKQGAVANVVFKEDSIVEGILYEVYNIEQLDRFEGAPNHYKRIQMMVGDVKAWVYVAQPKYIREGLKPKQEYLNHLLAGKSYMSDTYFEKLQMLNS